MKPHPRIRKTIKWGGAAVTVLLVVVWIGSGWWIAGWIDSRRPVVGVLGGYLYVGIYSDGPTAAEIPWVFHRHDPPTGIPRYGFKPWWVSAPTAIRVAIPLWLPAMCSLAFGAVAWRLDTLARRRARLNLCPKCNYDRAGIAKDAVCPECGTGAAGAA